RPWRLVLLLASGMLALGMFALYFSYRRDLDDINGRLTTRSQTLQTSHGLVEYAVRGEGAPALVIHGAGGGYDQGLRIAETFGGDGFRWISPSRFGYLRTPLPSDASTAAQADALADLLDALNVKRVAILA